LGVREPEKLGDRESRQFRERVFLMLNLWEPQYFNVKTKAFDKSKKF